MKIDLKETNIVIDENCVYAVYAADKHSLDSFSAIFYGRNEWLASCFFFTDGKTLNDYKGDYFCLPSLKDSSKGYHLKYIIKILLGSRGKSDGVTNLLNEYKKVKMGDLDDVEKVRIPVNSSTDSEAIVHLS